MKFLQKCYIINIENNDKTFVNLKGEFKGLLMDKNNLIIENNDNDFISSIDEFGAKDIESSMVLAKKKNNTSFSTSNIIILFICAATFIYSLVMLLAWKISSDKSDDYYDEIQNLFNRESVVELPKTINKTFLTYSLSDTLNGIGSGIEFIPQDRLDYFEEMMVKLNRIKAIAAFPEQVYGWIKMDNTIIDYPILKAADNDYYLRRLPNGMTADSGSIFADYRGTNIHMDNRHVVLYGHNRADGSMFTQLKYLFWPSKDYDQYKNARIELITEDGIYTYKIFSIYTATTGNYYIKYEFKDDQDYVDFLQSIYDQNLFNGYKEARSMKSFIDKDTKLLTFSTCTNNQLDRNQRYVVHCVLIDKTEPQK